MAFKVDEAFSFTLPFDSSSLFDFEPVDDLNWAWTDATAPSESADVFGDCPAWIDSPASSSSPAGASSSSSSSLSADSPASSSQFSPFPDAALALPSPPSGALDAFAPHSADLSSTICPTALHIPTDIQISLPSPPSPRHTVFSFPANPHPSHRARAASSSSHASVPAGPKASTSCLPPYYNNISSSRPPAPLPSKHKRSRPKPPPKAGPAALAQRQPSLSVRAAPSLADLFKAVSDAESRSRKRKESPREGWYEGRLKQWQAASGLPGEAAETSS